LEPGTLLPPPSFLKRKIIIKNKKKHHHHHHHHHKDTSQSDSQSSLQQDVIGSAGATGEAVQGNGDIPHHPPIQIRQSSKESAHEEDENGEPRVLIQYICACFNFQLDVDV
jgi:phosphatidylinositol phospholipase C beta